MKKIISSLLILFFILNFVQVARADSNNSDTPVLSVTGQGEAKAKPDIAFISIAVDRKGKTASEAASVSASATQKLLDALNKAGIDQKDIETSNVNINPIYKANQPSFDGESKVIGYDATNQIQVTVRNVNDVGHIIDVVVLTGDYTIGGLTFSLEKDENSQAEALKSAVADARKKADIVATAAGKMVAGIKNITIGGEGGSIFKSVSATAVEGISTPVLPGDIMVSASVSIEYLLNK